MLSLQTFIRHTSLALLGQYFEDKGHVLLVHTQEHRQRLLTAISQLALADQKAIELDAELIVHLSRPSGRVAIRASLDPTDDIQTMSPLDASCWVFLNRPDNFKKAQQWFYQDRYRCSQYWSGYQVAQALPIDTNKKVVEQFAARVTSSLSIHGELIVDIESNSSTRLIATLYTDALASESSRVVYDRSTGSLDVMAPSVVQRYRIAQAFVDVILKQPASRFLLIQRYCLMPLMNKPHFTWDIQDGIHCVRVAELTLRDLAGEGRLCLELPCDYDVSIYHYAQLYFGERNPFSSREFVPVKATVIIHFHPDNQGAGRVLPITISLPNSCDLKSRTSHERQLGEKYLMRWGLLGPMVVSS